MDRSSLPPPPPPPHSASTSAIPRSSLSSGGDAAASPANPSSLHRGYSDGATSTAAASPDRDTFLREYGVDTEAGGRSEGNGGPRGMSQPNDSATADRKRRLTAPESPERRSGYRPATGEGSSQATAIDLTRSPDGGSAGDAARRGSDIMIPPWQPDADVSHCPVCGTQFSFWYRKHHCRKCGRVVCANCSPHRITIPRQYIVRAPDEVRLSRAGLIDLGEDDGSRFDMYFNPALGGGEEVRVCNPCVPDPNLSPPPRHASSQFPNFDSSGFQDLYGQHRYSPLQPSGRSRNMTYDSSHAYGQRQYSHHRQSLSDVSQRSTDPFRSSRVSFQNRSSVSDLFPPPLPATSGSRSSTGASAFPSYQSHPSTAFPHFSHHMRPSRSSSASSNSPHPSRYRVVDTTTPPYPPSMQPPRRQIPEEDECPVCHEELPPKGPDGSTVAREAHVENCISANFAGPSSQSRTSTPSAAIEAAVHANAARPSDAGGASSAPSSAPPVAESSRRRRHTQGMLRYRASEKDCVDEKGDPQECIICFEDFHEGDEMGRLECFCKFHRTCIRQWWDTKGDGSCPTHQGGFVLGGPD